MHASQLEKRSCLGSDKTALGHDSRWKRPRSGRGLDTILKAIEFFSGIGAFSFVAAEFGIDVAAAFDQSQTANCIYEYNFGKKARSRNLDTIGSAEIPEADLWWMSPPCKPFSRRGKRNDLEDPRSGAFKNLLEILPEKRPAYLALENVLGFLGSEAEAALQNVLQKLSYSYLSLELCPTDFGIPMRRPRVFYLASRVGELNARAFLVKEKKSLSEFCLHEYDRNFALVMDEPTQEKYLDSLNIVEPDDKNARVICFTSGYGRSLRASGSYLRLNDGKLRLFSREEILLLFGFPNSFAFPENMELRTCLKHIGNSIELHSLRFALSCLLGETAGESSDTCRNQTDISA